jgi:neuronal cell adhesion protein
LQINYLCLAPHYDLGERSVKLFKFQCLTLFYSCFPPTSSGQYQCYATNEWGTATTNSVFVRKSELNNFKDEPPKTVSVEEGLPFGINCDSPDGWPPPSVYWMLQGQNWLKTINSSRMTVDPEGKLWFSNVTRHDASNDFMYACSAASYFRNEYKLGNKVHLQVIQSGSSAGLQNKHQPVLQYASKRNDRAYR